MATINSKKLLPGSEKKEVFLVPTKNIVPSAPKLGGVKPGEKKATKTSLLLEGKVIQVTELFNNNLLLKAADRERKRKDEERKEFEEREKKLEEKKLGKKGQQESLVSKVSGSSIFDKLARFTGFTLLGFVFNNYSNLLPRLTALGAIIKPAAVGIGYFAEGILSSTIDWIEKGYKAYDTVRDWTKKLGGENFQKLFDDFSGALNVFLNTAIIAGLAGIRGGAFKKGPLGLDGGGSPGAATAPLEKQIRDARRYLSKYSFRTVKETAPITESRILNMLTRTAMGLPAAKNLPTRQALKDPKFATAYKPQKETYVSSRDKALSKSIALGGEERSALRKAGIGTLTPKDQKKIDSLGYKALKNIGLTDKQIYDAFGFGSPRKGIPFDERSEKPTKPSQKFSAQRIAEAALPEKGKIPQIPTQVSGSKTVGQVWSTEIARIKRSYLKYNYSNTDLLSIVNNEATGAYFERKAAYDILVKRGLAGRVQNVPMSPPFPPLANRTPQGILRNQQIGAAPSIPKPGQGIIPTPQPAGVFGRGSKRAVERAALKVGGRGAVKFVRGIPVVGALIDFLFSIAMGDPPDEAAAGAAGAALGAAAAGLIVGTGTFGLGTILGGIVGGFVGDIIGRTLYKTAKAIFGKKQKPKKYAQGGVVDSRRQIKSTQKKNKFDKEREPMPTPTRMGYFSEMLGEIYGKTDGKSTLGIIQSASSKLKKVASYSGFLASLMGGTMDLLLGQPFDSGLLRYIGKKYGKQTESAVRNAGDAVINLLRKSITFKKEGGDESGGGGGGAFAPLREPKRSDFPMGRGGTKAYENALKRYRLQQAQPGQPDQDIPYVDPDTGISLYPGDRNFLESRGSHTHGGEDIGADSGTPLRAISDGEIIDSGDDPGGWGNFVVYKDANGYYHLYGHVQGGYKAGGKIKKGDIIAKVGMTGRTRGPHLHWEVGTGWTGGVIEGRIDPLSVYKFEQPFFTKKEEVDLGPQALSKKADAQEVAKNTSYGDGVVSNSILMVRTLIQPMMVG